MIRTTAAVAASLVLAAPAAGQGSAGADVTCSRVGATMDYDCVLVLAGALRAHPVQGAAIVTGVDTPASAHDVRPVKAEPTGKPGEYKFRLTVAGHGEWAVKVRLARPRQDIVVRKVMFAP